MDENFYRKEKPQWRKPESWLKRLVVNNFFKFVFLPLLIILFLFIISNKGPIKRIQLENEKILLEEKIKQAKAEQERLKNQLRLLETDKFYIEKAAREKHNMAKEGETVYKLKKTQ